MRIGRDNGRKGQALVEFAITLPIAMLFVFGAIDFARFMFVQECLYEVARDVARSGILRGAADADLQLYGLDKLSSMGVGTTYSPTVTVQAISATTGNPIADSDGDGKILGDEAWSGDTIVVETSANFLPVVGGLIPGWAGGKVIRGRCMLLME